MPETWTILKLLNWTEEYFKKKNLPQARLDAEILLAHTLSMQRIQLYMQHDRPMSPIELTIFKGYIKRRADFEPIAYITGSKDFWAQTFLVNKHVLIPRPDTELIIETILAEKKPFNHILDIGTGSGILAITLALEFPQSKVTAIDISPDALSVATENAARLGANNIDFICISMDDFKPSPDTNFDLIVSNPPYIDPIEIKTLMPDVKNHEPNLALDGGPFGLKFYPTIAKFAQNYLASEGEILVEIGESQGQSVQNIFQEAGFENCLILKDYASHDRVVKAKNPQTN